MKQVTLSLHHGKWGTSLIHPTCHDVKHQLNVHVYTLYTNQYTVSVHVCKCQPTVNLSNPNSLVQRSVQIVIQIGESAHTCARCSEITMYKVPVTIFPCASSFCLIVSSIFAQLLSSITDSMHFEHISNLVPRRSLESGNQAVGLSQSFWICMGSD